MQVEVTWPDAASQFITCKRYVLQESGAVFLEGVRVENGSAQGQYVDYAIGPAAYKTIAVPSAYAVGIAGDKK